MINTQKSKKKLNTNNMKKNNSGSTQRQHLNVEKEKYNLKQNGKPLKASQRKQNSGINNKII